MSFKEQEKPPVLEYVKAAKRAKSDYHRVFNSLGLPLKDRHSLLDGVGKEYVKVDPNDEDSLGSLYQNIVSEIKDLGLCDNQEFVEDEITPEYLAAVTLNVHVTFHDQELFKARRDLYNVISKHF